MKPAEIERLLPWIFRRTASPGSPLAALLEVMAVLHAPVEDVLANLDALSAKRQRTLPGGCTMYSLMNFASDMPTAKRQFLGLDIGTSSVKACVVDERGRTVGA